MKRARFPFQPGTGSQGAAVLMPVLPLTLRLGGQEISVLALADTGSAINVLPWSAGAALGARWEELDTPVQLTGTLGATEARALIVEGVVAGLPAVRLVFAWTKSDAIPVLLGQVNFFMQFDVCFFRKAGLFEVSAAQ